MVVYRRRFPNFYTMRNRRVLVDEEFNSLSTSTLRFVIDYNMNNLSIIDWKQHHYPSDEIGRSEVNYAPIKELS